MRISYAVVKNLDRGGGIEKYTKELGERLAARGHRITVYTMKHYGAIRESAGGLRVVPVPCIRGARTEKLSAGISASSRALFADPRADIVHYHSIGAGGSALLARLRSQKCVLQMHGVEWQRNRWGGFGRGVLRLLETLSFAQCHEVTAVSRQQCRHYEEVYGRKVHYIPTGAEICRSVPADEILRLGLEPGNYILFAARLVREKGAHHLIPAFRALETECRLVIAGHARGAESYRDELLELAAGDRRVHFPGFVEGRLLSELFSHARFFVQPSELEGLSISLLEAMGYGCCCLVSDIEPNREALGGAGVMFRSGDVCDLREKMRGLLNNTIDTSALGEEARERVRAHYSWDAVADRFEDLYQRLLAR